MQFRRLSRLFGPAYIVGESSGLISEDQCSEFPQQHVVLDGRESVGLRSHHDGFVSRQVLSAR